MTEENILLQIKNNLQWLDINPSGKTWQELLQDLDKEEKQQAMAIETKLLIKLFLNKFYIIREMEI